MTRETKSSNCLRGEDAYGDCYPPRRPLTRRFVVPFLAFLSKLRPLSVIDCFAALHECAKSSLAARRLSSPHLTLNLRTEMAMADGIVSHKITKKPPTSLAHPLSSALRRYRESGRRPRPTQVIYFAASFRPTNFRRGKKPRRGGARRLRQRRGGGVSRLFSVSLLSF